MGICPSRCGGKQGAPAVKPPPAAATADPLSTKLTAAASPYDPTHSLKRFLHLNQEPTKSATSTPRTSLVESLATPHSSELFSLPGSEVEPRTSYAQSPPRRAPKRAPTEGASLSSHFTLKSPRKGRNSKRIRPATRGEHVDLAAHLRVVDAIARLERLNDAEKASMSGAREFVGAPLVTASETCSGELNKPAVRSRHVRHYQLPLQKSSVATAPISHLPSGIPASLDTTPAVTDFLRTMEAFVSLIEEPRQLRNPRASGPSTATNRRRLEDTDSEELFSLEFGPSEARGLSKVSPARKKSVPLQRLLQPGAQASSGRRLACAGAAMASGESEEKSYCSTWQPIEDCVKQPRTVDSMANARVSAESSMKQSSREHGGVVAAKPLRDSNLLAIRKVKSPRLALRMKAFQGLRRRRLSQSLDSIESEVIHVDLEIFRCRGATPIAASRLSTVSSANQHSPEAATSADAKRTEVSELEPSGSHPSPEVNQNCCTGLFETSSRPEQAASEILQPQDVVPLVEDPILRTETAESSSREPAGNLDMEIKCEETLPSDKFECTGSEPPHIESKVVLPFNVEGLGISLWFRVLETFLSLLKLLFFSMELDECTMAIENMGTIRGDEENLQD